jgi:hypothetical protein
MEEGNHEVSPSPQPENSTPGEVATPNTTEAPKTFTQLADHMEGQREENKQPSQPLTAAGKSRRGFLGGVLGLLGITAASAAVGSSVVGGMNVAMDSTPQDGSDQQAASKPKKEALYTGTLGPSTKAQVKSAGIGNTTSPTTTQGVQPDQPGIGGSFGGASSGLSKGSSSDLEKGS